MVQKCSNLEVLKVFFLEPTRIHFIREIGKKINLAPTSVKKYLDEFVKEGLVVPKKSNPFNGYVANRENEEFIFYKKIYNLYSLGELKEFLEKNSFPKLAVVFGSYSLGEDIESSDIDLLIISKSKKKVDLKKFEKKLKREINVLIINGISKLEKPVLNKVYNGFVICGGFDLL